jgi:chemotaxis protein MotB
MRQRPFIHRRTSSLEPSTTGGWQIIYTGFILIMLSFFIMLTSFASLQKAKITRFARAFSSAVSVFQEGNRIESGKTVHDTDVSLLDKQDHLARLFETVRTLGREAHLEGVSIERSRRGVVMTLAETLLFASGQAKLSPQAYPLLEKVGRLISTVSVPVEIEGHTDNVPINNDRYPSNWELSTARAINVLRFFIGKKWSAADRISAVGRAEFQPLYANDTPENRARNRRVEIIFKAD